MADVFAGRRGPAAGLLAALAVAVVAAGCEPTGKRGFAKVTHRGTPQGVAYAHPDPPAVTPGTSVGAAPARVTLASPPAGVTQAMVDEGQQNFGLCAGCHGQGGTGSPAAPALNDAEWINISGQYPEIVTIITSGVPAPRQHPAPMPPRGGGSFTDAQVRSLAAYVYALSRQGGA
ncbi:MAG TPA: c-type cytochrome [Longimicrobium sp.]|nr:c-type cytochrome [Longimicrobium sp.]